MHLAKPCLDVGLFTDKWPAAERYWRDDIGLEYEETLPIGGGVAQHRFVVHGSVIKVNHSRAPLDDAPTGYVGLSLAWPAAGEGRTTLDPDGLPVSLVAPGDGGVIGIGIHQLVSSVAAFRDFYVDALEAEELGPNRYLIGTTLVVCEPSDRVDRSGPLLSRGFRYITIQVHDVRSEHERLLAKGVEQGSPPRVLGDVAAISFVRDPDGNLIEISQRASLTGPLSIAV